jgi:serine/threonine protein kinase
MLRSKRERLVLALRESPFVVQVDFGFQDPELLFLVSKFQSGGNLSSRLRRVGVMQEAEVRFYISEIALGLAWFHDKHIVYRHLKPRNVLLDAEGHIRLSELSVCLESWNVRDFVLSGDPDYSAPELLKGVRYDLASDYWSLVRLT